MGKKNPKNKTKTNVEIKKRQISQGIAVPR